MDDVHLTPSPNTTEWSSRTAGRTSTSRVRTEASTTWSIPTDLVIRLKACQGRNRASAIRGIVTVTTSAPGRLTRDPRFLSPREVAELHSRTQPSQQTPRRTDRDRLDSGPRSLPLPPLVEQESIARLPRRPNHPHRPDRKQARNSRSTCYRKRRERPVGLLLRARTAQRPEMAVCGVTDGWQVRPLRANWEVRSTREEPRPT